MRLRIALRRLNSGHLQIVVYGRAVHKSFTDDARRRCSAPWAAAMIWPVSKVELLRSMADDKPAPIRPIAHLNGEKPSAPDWFTAAVTTPSEEASVNVSGADIRYSAWGEKGRPGLLFIHGGRAHRNWWRPFAPFFAKQYRVAAFDISGMGDSGWRDQYSLDLTTNELFAVIEAAGLEAAGRPLVVGHSFGGWITLAAVERGGERLGGAVIVDSPISKPDPDEGYTIVRKKTDEPIAVRPSRIYSTIEEPISRFRFLPNQPCDQHYLVDFIARQGLKQVTGETGAGWTWKFDPGHGANFDIHFERDLFLAARCPLAFIYGEQSFFVGGDGFKALKQQTDGRAPIIEMPGVHHHLMMEEPIAFISTLQTLLKCWPVRVGV